MRLIYRCCNRLTANHYHHHHRPIFSDQCSACSLTKSRSVGPIRHKARRFNAWLTSLSVLLFSFLKAICWRAYCALMKDWTSDTMGFFRLFLPSLGGFECNALILNRHFYGLLCSTMLLSVMLLICHMQQPDYWVDNVGVMTCCCYAIMLSLLFGTGLCLVYSRPLGLITGIQLSVALTPGVTTLTHLRQGHLSGILVMHDCTGLFCRMVVSMNFTLSVWRQCPWLLSLGIKYQQALNEIFSELPWACN